MQGDGDGDEGGLCFMFFSSKFSLESPISTLVLECTIQSLLYCIELDFLRHQRKELSFPRLFLGFLCNC